LCCIKFRGGKSHPVDENWRPLSVGN
jgi:hypothetical protein